MSKWITNRLPKGHEQTIEYEVWMYDAGEYVIRHVDNIKIGIPWCKIDPPQPYETIPIPDVRVVETDAHDSRERFAVYLNDVNFGIYDNQINAENYVKTIKQALGITIEVTK